MVRGGLIGVVALGAVLCAGGVSAQDADTLTIGYLQIKDDPRYDDDRAYARIQLRPLGRPFGATQVALDEAQSIARVLKKSIVIEKAEVDKAEELIGAIDRLNKEKKVGLFLLDAPGAAVRDVAAKTRGRPILLFNVSAPEDSLRNKECQAHLMHTMPSDAMLTDALAQFVVSRKWNNVLVLQGPLPEDALFVRAFERSAKRFGAKIAAKRPFELTNDPRQREQSNVRLLTEGVGHDVVLVADTDGEFGRYVPYATLLPRPVIGTVGLVPDTWHWSSERNGAPQLNSRFEKKFNRRMTGQDWAAWIAVKAIAQGLLRTKSVEFDALAKFIRSDEIKVDGFKGPALNFRPWDNQLRQPIFLATHNAVIEKAPIRGFLHTLDDLDTLGDDKPDTQCKF